MSATAALNLHQAIDEFSTILACEALIAAEAIEYAERSMCPQHNNCTILLEK